MRNTFSLSDFSAFFSGCEEIIMRKNKLFFAAILCCAVSGISAQRTVYVSPEGNDTWNGDKEKPFQTLDRAFAEAVDFSADTLYINVASGDYHLNKTVRLSGSVGSPVVVRGDKLDMPRFLGGMQVRGWEKYKGNIYRAFIPEVKLYDFSFEQFYVNGKRATWARTPNKDWYMVKGYKEFAYVSGVRSANYATQRIELDKVDMQTLKGLSADELADVRFRFYHKWDITQKQLSYACPDSGYMYLQGGGMKPWNPVTEGSRYIMYGYKSALDTAGEWYLDKAEGYVYYIPREGEDMSTAECMVPTLHQWLVVEGEKGKPVKDIRFENLSFQYSAFRMPRNGNEPMQAAATVEAAVELERAENISFVNCEMMHTGGYALWLKSACRNNKVDHCYIADLGAGGIKIGVPVYTEDSTMVSRHNIVNNSIITHAGSELPCGVGVAIFHSSDNQVTHNEISDLRYSGVSVGWVWGYNNSYSLWTNVLMDDGTVDFKQIELVSPAVRNLVAYNHIHHIGWGELSDMGAVYTLGESPGTRIVNNIIHDILSYDYGGWGLYTDEGSTGVEMSSNLVYRCKSGGFHQHYGKENRIENNIFAFGHFYQAQYTRVEPHLSFHFRHNIILQDEGETLAGPWEKGNLDMDYNLYWHLNGEPEFGKHSFGEWKKLKEKHSILADPLFMDAENDDFRFRSMKAARKIGFKPWDFSKVGVYGSDEWKDKAKMNENDIKVFEEIRKERDRK